MGKAYTITLQGRSDLIEEYLKLDKEIEAMTLRKEEIIEQLHNSELICQNATEE